MPCKSTIKKWIPQWSNKQFGDYGPIWGCSAFEKKSTFMCLKYSKSGWWISFHKIRSKTFGVKNTFNKRSNFVLLE